ncbi:MAG: hypothetical protein A3C93_06485 [Candidatus Lloydbacteria bacterium RIFCSPHIGHO2_02_FULL_54_17]|uniref:Rhodanese domain-containing protein n=1 Tax=Candidatus Lloydbacteria bacterium RIFCSPHIGHO2_02_FULL_54_17 TaxID=1798664 RepID=A0A1G2DC29_9BACT|nr:MAG: hypothetical protein A2762_05260 [Candidatus Lloydbacteria bacterium RIFCSPHIGHO2_01_FULL_54_11]OGZ11179.1 MAG: hypothetical protein A3C93_06485 [Candidatus Lloydbacteria bacterium RIFCSPHIGHO2_02_FULL_54_17]OGZ14997.1 MAG: hypothetical protein A2948_00935 [Candidatus Lloydbacteria bacterium RIFCSPLOWO2_01_FULL_54_18]OGZ15274.1 MAG: hypothetical protein A3H76_03155 [Candidatus Lloydbacteria bacterium RIFCSPLOWO2_02_FULL_54_12]
MRQALEQPAEGVLFVDVRTKTEWEKGHIAGFRHIPMSELAEHVDELKRYPKVYFLCHSGGRSGRACALLARNGHQGAINVLGGWSEWVARGYPVER